MTTDFRALDENLIVQTIGRGIILLGALSALVCGVIGLVLKARKTRDHRRFARWARRLGGAVLLLAVLGAVSGLVHTYAVIEAQGLSAVDRQRILANGTAEALYNLMFGIVLGGPGFALGLFGRGK